MAIKDKAILTKIRVAFFCSLLTLTASCQKDFGQLDKVCALADELYEISGCTIIGSKLYAINDSGNSNDLFEVSPATGKVIRKIEVTNATNKDWEALTTDRQGNMYIGDFGNNSNKRKDLVVYRVSKDQITAGSKKITAQKIEFKLEGQENFPPKKKNRTYDIEGFLHFRNSLYLFTKNRSKDFDGTTTVYRLPDVSGTYEAKEIAEWKTCKDDKDCFITDAALSPDGKTAVFLTYNKVFVMSPFDPKNMDDDKITKYKLDYRSQKEAVTFKDESTLWIADEKGNASDGNLYEYKIPKE